MVTFQVYVNLVVQLYEFTYNRNFILYKVKLAFSLQFHLFQTFNSSVARPALYKEETKQMSSIIVQFLVYNILNLKLESHTVIKFNFKSKRILE